jgi:dephospho-CoA kinase
MLLVGLTGGIGSGKSTAAQLLAERGAVVIDADVLARRALDPGTPGHAAAVQAFGESILGDGAIDRDRLAQLVFHDDDARARLEGIVHPEVARLFAEAVEPYRGTQGVVVYVVPLLVENGLQSMFDVVVVIRADESVRAARLRARGMSMEDTEARMRAQLPDEERERVAAIVVPNDGSLAELERRIDALWADLETRVTPL